MHVRLKALAAAASLVVGIGLATPAQAQLTYLGNFGGTDCGGQGGFSNCYATQTGTVQGNPTNPLLLASPAVYKINNGGNPDSSTLFPTIAGSEFSLLFDALTNNLSFTYTAGAGDPNLHYVVVKQASDFALFYDANPIVAGSLNLSTYFPNNPGWSHITFFNSGTGAVPEPGTWAMMLLGFGGIGVALRRRRKLSNITQFA